MRIYLNEELWGILRKKKWLFVCSAVSSCSSRDVSGVSIPRQEAEICRVWDAASIPEPKGCVRCQQEAVLSAVPRIVLAFWGSETSATFPCAQTMLGICQMVHSWGAERLGKDSWFPGVSLNSSSCILMHTHRCCMWFEAEGNTCHSSWTQLSQSFKEIQG